MEYIRNRDGQVIGRSRNLAGIRRYVGRCLVKTIALDRLTVQGMEHDGRMSILFEDGSSFETTFADYGVMVDWVARWRSVWGAPLILNGHRAGVVNRSLARKVKP